MKIFFKFVEDWVYRGEINFQNEEFFIEETKKQYWEKFELKIEKIPKNLEYSTAKSIFNIGRSLNYLKNYCSFYL